MQELPRKYLYTDIQGRFTIPKYMRETLKIDEGKVLLVVEYYPDDKNPKALLVTKGY